MGERCGADAVCAVKRNAPGRRRDKHKKAEQDAAQAAVADEPEQQQVDEVDPLIQSTSQSLDGWTVVARKGRRGNAEEGTRGGTATMEGRTTQEIPRCTRRYARLSSLCQ